MMRFVSKKAFFVLVMNLLVLTILPGCFQRMY